MRWYCGLGRWVARIKNAYSEMICTRLGAWLGCSPGCLASLCREREEGRMKFGKLGRLLHLVALLDEGGEEMHGDERNLVRLYVVRAQVLASWLQRPRHADLDQLFVQGLAVLERQEDG